MTDEAEDFGLLAATLGGAGGAAAGLAVSVFVKTGLASLSAALWAAIFALPTAALFALPFALAGTVALWLIERWFGLLSLHRAEALGADDDGAATRGAREHRPQVVRTFQQGGQRGFR